MVKNAAFRVLLAGATILGIGLTWDEAFPPRNLWERVRLRALIATDLLTGQGDLDVRFL